MTLDELKDWADEQHIAGKWPLILRLSVLDVRRLKDSYEWMNAMHYADPEQLRPGEVGRVYGVRIIEAEAEAGYYKFLGITQPMGEAIFDLGSLT